MPPKQSSRQDGSSHPNAPVLSSAEDRGDLGAHAAVFQSRRIAVEFQDADMAILRGAMDGRHALNLTCKQVLQSLDGVGLHTEAQWTSFFLERIGRFEFLPPDHERFEQSPAPQPPSSFGLPLHVQSRSPTRPQLPACEAETSIPSEQQLDTKGLLSTLKKGRLHRARKRVSGSTCLRQDNNSRSDSDDAAGTAHSAARLARYSHSPTPPPHTRTSANARYRYTEDDAKYAVAVGQKMRRQDPGVPLSHIVLKISEKASHHSAASWRQYIDKHPGLRRRIDARHDQAIVKPFLKREDSSDEHASVHGRAGTSSRPLALKETEDSDIELDLVVDAPGDATEDERNLSKAKSAYKPSDERVLARYIVLHPEWHERTIRENIRLFYQQYHWSRSELAWAEFYRKRKAVIDNLATRIQLQPRCDKKGKGKHRPTPEASRSRTSDEDERGPVLRSRTSSQRCRTKMATTNAESSQNAMRRSRTAETEATPLDDAPRSSLKRNAPDSGFDESDHGGRAL